MPHAALSAVVARLGRPAADESDGRLLGRFVRDRDEAAFAELVRATGPMVLGVCRRVCRDAHLAEDAFQAAFLVLARRARDVRPTGSVRGWLHGVAVRTAREARAVSARRRSRETPVPTPPETPSTPPTPTDPDALAALDEEIAALPDHLRAAVVLCELDGLSRKAAAARLGVPEGTLSSRLGKARRVLGAGLRKRGIALSAAGLAVLGHAAVPPRLAAAATALTSASSAVPPAVAALSHGVLRTMYFQKLKVAAAAAMLLALAGVVAGGAAPSSAQDGPKSAVALLQPAVVLQPLPKTADPKPLPRPVGPGKLLVVRAERFEFRSPGGDAAGTPPAHPHKAIFLAGRISPDGKWFAYTAQPLPGAPEEELRKGQRLFVRDLTKEDKLTAVDVSVRHLCWSPDGSRLLAIEHPADERGNPQPDHWLIDPKSGAKELLSLPPGHVHDWSPDGNSFLMSVLDAKRNEARLSAVSRDGKEETTLHRMRRPCWMEVCRFSPDGRKVLFGVPEDEQSEEWLKSLPRLFVLDVATKARREVAEVPLNASVTGVCWSPDGKRIAYQWRPVPLPLAKKRFGDLTDEERSVETEEFVVVADPDGKNVKVVASDKGPLVNSVIITSFDWR
jgi:RNA polymerase sigma factor (sigma-70 family)